MAISSYSIGDYRWLLVTILLMAINSYSIGAYGAYSINGYS
jgi:hypothetical protein